MYEEVGNDKKKVVWFKNYSVINSTRYMEKTICKILIVVSSLNCH